ncbi:Plasmodium vivax Vir protein, putative [Plasmodium vivax]|uniref:Vir protein, putative n=1 Tax=Plasmodium vivax TaxID=5855 RepID=A0A1G4E890_PLAVI|nr:Plasmodium vivax Vir protein, putative [Plasmodium vivax]
MDQSIYYKIENLCNLLIRNLEDLHRNKYEEYYSNGSCKLLNDWLYEKVKTALGSCHIGNCKEILDNLHMAWKKYITGGLFMTKIDNKCKPETLIPNFQDIEDKKLIHEHCFNYYEISKKSTNVDECKSYKEYIKDASLRYGEFESLFAEDKANYGTYYEKCKSYNPINISTYSNCPNEIKISEASGDVATLSGQSSLEAGRERELREEEGHVSEGEERESGVRGVDGGDVRGDEERVESMEIIQSNLDPGVVMGSGLAHVEGAGYVDSGPSPSSVNNSSVMPFTPLRSVFNKLSHKNKNPMNHLHDIREELLEYMSTSDSKNRDNIPNYIAYHPT